MYGFIMWAKTKQCLHVALRAGATTLFTSQSLTFIGIAHSVMWLRWLNRPSALWLTLCSSILWRRLSLKVKLKKKTCTATRGPTVKLSLLALMASTAKRLRQLAATGFYASTAGVIGKISANQDLPVASETVETPIDELEIEAGRVGASVGRVAPSAKFRRSSAQTNQASGADQRRCAPRPGWQAISWPNGESQLTTSSSHSWTAGCNLGPSLAKNAASVSAMTKSDCSRLENAA